MKLQHYVVDGANYLGAIDQPANGLEGLAKVISSDFESQVVEYLTLQNVGQLTTFSRLDNVSVKAIPLTPERAAQVGYIEACFKEIKKTAIKHVENQQLREIVGK